MSLCINPRCPEPDHPGNDTSTFCQSCGSDLVLQNRYRVLRLISDKSGFGKVYEAYERSTPKILKVLKEVHSHNDKAVELFQQEAEVLSQLHHPGIPLIEPHGYFQFLPRDGLGVIHCIVMEKIDGPNLREWMKQQGNHAIGQQQALDWLQQIAEVLHLVHQKNYFHRDIKPENLMLRSSGQVVLVDFGAAREMTYTYLAQLSGGSSGVTKISSAGYTPPEQEHGQAVPQSDFYALGRTFIYLMTGRLPTDNSIYDPVHNEFHWRAYAPHIAPPLADFIDKLIAPRASDRPRSTQDMLDQLHQLTDELSHYPSTPSGLPLTPSSANRTTVNPATVQQMRSKLHLFWQTPIVIGIAAVLVVVTGFGIWQRYRSLNLFPAIAEAKVTLLTTLSGHNGNVNDIVLSPGGQTLVSVSSDNSIKVWDWLTGTVLRTLAGHASFVNAVTVSPDGHNIISGSADRTIKVWDLQTGALLRTLQGHNSFINSVIVSHDGQFIISGGADGSIKIWDFQTGKALKTLVGHVSAVNALVMSRDGKQLISGSSDGEIKSWDMATGKEKRAIADDDNPVNALVVSLDGKTLISGNAAGTIQTWNLNTGDPQLTLTGHTGAVNVLQLSDDGHTLYSGSADQTVRLWDLRTGKTLYELEGFSSYVNELAITTDPHILITNSAGGNIRVWQVPESVR
jgi:WD40 repeat protein